MRLDSWLVEQGCVRSRERAKDAIKAGLVKVDGKTIRKASFEVHPEHAVLCEGETHPYVSRGALKLEKGLQEWDIDPSGKICLDLGASTGGFTEILLKAGAAKVYAVDVGYNQLVPKLREHPRVINLEKTNAKDLTVNLIDDPLELIVCDVSFISLLKALPAALRLAAPSAILVTLVKPQFELGKEHLGKGGIVSMPALQQQDWIKDHIYPNLRKWGWHIMGLIESPIKGGDGNTEYLLGTHRET